MLHVHDDVLESIFQTWLNVHAFSSYAKKHLTYVFRVSEYEAWIIQALSNYLNWKASLSLVLSMCASATTWQPDKEIATLSSRASFLPVCTFWLAQPKVASLISFSRQAASWSRLWAQLRGLPLSMPFRQLKKNSKAGLLNKDGFTLVRKIVENLNILHICFLKCKRNGQNLGSCVPHVLGDKYRVTENTASGRFYSQALLSSLSSNLMVIDQQQHT